MGRSRSCDLSLSSPLCLRLTLFNSFIMCGPSGPMSTHGFLLSACTLLMVSYEERAAASAHRCLAENYVFYVFFPAEFLLFRAATLGVSCLKSWNFPEKRCLQHCCFFTVAQSQIMVTHKQTFPSEKKCVAHLLLLDCSQLLSRIKPVMFDCPHTLFIIIMDE